MRKTPNCIGTYRQTDINTHTEGEGRGGEGRGREEERERGGRRGDKRESRHFVLSR